MVPNGRRDSLRGFMDLANDNLPGPSSTLKQLKDRFKNVGLDRSSDLVALSGMLLSHLKHFHLYSCNH